MHGKANNKDRKRGSLGLYRSYNFVNKDPVIDRIRTIMATEHVDNKDASIISGVSRTTLHNWFDGKTRRPQYAPIAAVVRSLGYTEKFVRAKRINIAAEVEKVAAEIAKGKK